MDLIKFEWSDKITFDSTTSKHCSSFCWIYYMLVLSSKWASEFLKKCLFYLPAAYLKYLPSCVKCSYYRKTPGFSILMLLLWLLSSAKIGLQTTANTTVASSATLFYHLLVSTHSLYRHFWVVLILQNCCLLCRDLFRNRRIT